MRYVIFLTFTILLFGVHPYVFAQSENKTESTYTINGTDVAVFTEGQDVKHEAPSPVINKNVIEGNFYSAIIGIAGILVSASAAGIGFYFGKRQAKNQSVQIDENTAETKKHISELANEVVEKNIKGINSLLRITGESDLGEVRLRDDGTVSAHHERGMNEHVDSDDTLTVKKIITFRHNIQNDNIPIQENEKTKSEPKEVKEDTDKTE